MNNDRFRKSMFAWVAALLLQPSGYGLAQQPESPPAESATAAGNIADFFSQVGDQIYEDCIFELSDEQIEVQQALIKAYIKQGAPSSLARRLAVKQIRPPELSDKCKQIRNQTHAAAPWTSVTKPAVGEKPAVKAAALRNPLSGRRSR